jgi:hypothetical protein
MLILGAALGKVFTKRQMCLPSGDTAMNRSFNFRELAETKNAFFLGFSPFFVTSRLAKSV